ncbi:MAG: CvpA family protein [Patescibacteria group bacterium]
MSTIDYVLLLVLAYFVIQGLRHGFLATIGSLVGLALGAWAAGAFYATVAQWLIELFDLSIMVSIVAAFIGIFVGINILMSLLINFVTHIFKYVPLATFANRLLGAALGFLQGMLLVGLILWVINLFPFQSSFAENVEKSRVAELFQTSTRIVQPLLPTSLRAIDFSALKDLQNLTDEKAEYLRQNMPKFFGRIREERDRVQERINQEIEAGASELDQSQNTEVSR